LNQGKCMCFGRDWPKPGTYAGACLVCWPCQSTPSLGWLTWRSSCRTKSKSSTGSIAARSSWGTEEPLPRHHIPANQWLQVTETIYSWMNYVSPGTCLIFFLTTKLCTTLPFSLLPTQCSYIGPPLHHSDIWVCHSQAMIGSFQIVLGQCSSLVQLFVVKNENCSHKQITSYIFTYHFYVIFYKLFVGGASQHIHGGRAHHFSGWASCEASSCLLWLARDPVG
jgi:hypothetical protein